MAPAPQSAASLPAVPLESAPSPRRQRRIAEHLGLVWHVLAKMKIPNSSCLDWDDLFAAGVIGLIDATDKYDDSRNVLFHTYATNRIRGAILDEVRRVDWLPRNLRDEISRMQTAREELHNQWGRPPSLGELAEALDAAPDRIDFLATTSAQEALPLPEEADAEEHCQDYLNQMGASLRDPKPDPAERAEHTETLRHLGKLARTLPDPERDLIAMFYHKGMTPQQVGAKLGISPKQTVWVHHKAIARLRRAFRRIAYEGLPKKKRRKRKRAG